MNRCKICARDTQNMGFCDQHNVVAAGPFHVGGMTVNVYADDNGHVTEYRPRVVAGFEMPYQHPAPEEMFCFSGHDTLEAAVQFCRTLTVERYRHLREECADRIGEYATLI
jgi:hypothetical protein